MGITGTERVLDPPEVLLEPCEAFEHRFEDPGVCAACGWLADDHADDHATDNHAVDPGARTAA